jgi:hypothetical protein
VAGFERPLSGQNGTEGAAVTEEEFASLLAKGYETDGVGAGIGCQVCPSLESPRRPVSLFSRSISFSHPELGRQRTKWHFFDRGVKSLKENLTQPRIQLSARAMRQFREVDVD